MYHSPIHVYEKSSNSFEDISISISRERNEYVWKCVQELFVDIDKEEFIRAMNYDRNQYYKGYRDGTEDKVEYCARMLEKAFGDAPCDVGFDEKCVGDEWCEKHCDNREDSKCWEHAIREGWIKDD